jgi:hypothetical protein
LHGEKWRRPSADAASQTLAPSMEGRWARPAARPLPSAAFWVRACETPAF